MSETAIAELRRSIIELDADKTRDIARKALAAGSDPVDLINLGIRGALDVMGERFSNGELFLPELVLAAQAADAAVEVLEPELLKSRGARTTLGKVLIATVKGDIHDIGKNIVALLMKSAGFEVVDLGVDKADREILEAAKKHEVDVVGLSALLTTTMPRMREFMELLQESGLRGKFKVIVGGAPVTKEFAGQIGADGYGADATRAVDVARQLLKR